MNDTTEPLAFSERKKNKNLFVLLQDNILCQSSFRIQLKVPSSNIIELETWLMAVIISAQELLSNPWTSL